MEQPGEFDDLALVLKCLREAGRPLSIDDLSRASGISDLPYLPQLISTLVANQIVRGYPHVSKDVSRTRFALVHTDSASELAHLAIPDYEALGEPNSDPDQTDAGSEGDSDLESADADLDSSEKALLRYSKRFPLLDSATTLLFLERAVSGDQVARDRLVEHYLSYISRIAHAEFPYERDIVDLVQEGAIAYIKAIEGFDKAQSITLRAYTDVWIRGSFARYRTDRRDLIRLPREMHDILKRIDQSKIFLRWKLNRDASDSEIAIHLSMSEEQLRACREFKRVSAASSLDESIGDAEDEQTLVNSLPCIRNYLPEEAAAQSELCTFVDSILSTLTLRQRHVLELRFGLLDGKALTLGAIAKRLNITRQGVRTIVSRALKRLKKFEKARSFLDDTCSEDVPTLEPLENTGHHTSDEVTSFFNKAAASIDGKENVMTNQPLNPPTELNATEIQKIQSEQSVFLRAQLLTSVHWQAVAAIWYRESFSVTPPKTPGGPFQFDPPDPTPDSLKAMLKRYVTALSEADIELLVTEGINSFDSACIFAACHLRDVTKFNLSRDHSDDAIKDAFYGYNGRAYGASPDESPYVMNNLDPEHMNMRIVGSLPDGHGGRISIDTIDLRPGAFVVYKQLQSLPVSPQPGSRPANGA